METELMVPISEKLPLFLRTVMLPIAKPRKTSNNLVIDACTSLL